MSDFEDGTLSFLSNLKCSIEFEYESEDYSSQDGSVDASIENLFYEADDCRNSDPNRSTELFEQLVRLCGNDQRWNIWYECCCFCPYLLGSSNRSSIYCA